MFRMKKSVSLLLSVLVLLGALAFSGCGRTDNPDTTSDGVINTQSTQSGNANPTGNEGAVFDGSVLENMVSFRIVEDAEKIWLVNIYNNAASHTMVGYLSNCELLFPTYTYSDEDGFVGENVRGAYTSDDEIYVTDINAGELYLFSDGQLRLYFKDVSGANITATPIGYISEADGIAEAVREAYESNLDDELGVKVYFLISRTPY